MNHYCPECMAVKEEVDLETYRCGTCKDTYCVHFMKTVDSPKMIEPPKMEPGYPRPKVAVPGKWTPGEYVCWVCGSEKKKGAT